jgi:hypothetical protein
MPEKSFVDKRLETSKAGRTADTVGTTVNSLQINENDPFFGKYLPSPGHRFERNVTSTRKAVLTNCFTAAAGMWPSKCTMETTQGHVFICVPKRSRSRRKASKTSSKHSPICSRLGQPRKIKSKPELSTHSTAVYLIQNYATQLRPSRNCSFHAIFDMPLLNEHLHPMASWQQQRM